MTTTSEYINRLEVPSGYVELFTLDATNLPGGSIWRFTTQLNSSLANVQFQGNTFLPLPIVTTSFGINGDGSQVKPQLIVANTHRVLMQAIQSLGDLVGAKLIRQITLESFLDGGADASETNRVIFTEKFIIEAKTEQNIERIVFTLCTPLSAFGKRIPNRLITRQGDARWCAFPGAGSMRQRR